MNCDVLVLGGGAAGIAAAMTAARTGAHVVLIERNGMLGGIATAALVHTVCGLYLLREEPSAQIAHTGFPAEFAARLIASGASIGPVRMGRVDVLPHSPPGFASVADSLVAGCGSLDVFFHSELTHVSRSGNHIREVEAICRGTKMSITPKATVDASGDALLAGHDCDIAPSERLQRPAFIFAISGADVGALDDDGRLKLARMLTTAVQCGALDSGVLGAHFRVTGRGSEVYVTIDLAAPAFDPTSPSQLTMLEQTGRHLANTLTSFLRGNHPAFHAAHIAAFPARVGIRESRRIRGKATVTAEDIISGRTRADLVALGTWPMESREKATGPRWRFPANLRPTQIPLDALRPSDLDNCWTAGRCISCEHEAQAALRVIGTCMATGQAAGAAAALFAQSGAAPDATQIRAVYAMEVPE
jgi:hypothetical protein